MPSAAAPFPAGRGSAAPPAALSDATAPPTLRQALLALVLAAGGAVIAGACVVAVVLFFFPEPSLVWVTVVAVWCVSLASLAGLLLALRRGRGLTWGSLGVRRPTWRLLHLLWQVPAAMLAGITVQGLFMTFVFTGEPAGQGAAAEAIGLTAGMQPAAAWIVVFALWAATAVLVPLWEELLFRGFLLQALRARLGWAAAVPLVALLFAGVHMVPPAMPYLFVVGLACGLLVRFHGNLWASVLLHAVNNTVVTLIAATVLL